MGNNGGLKVLVVDDHTLFRKGVMRIIESDPKIDVVDEAVSGKEAINQIQSNPYNCILLDIWLPGENGLQVLKQIKCIDPDIPVIRTVKGNTACEPRYSGNYVEHVPRGAIWDTGLTRGCFRLCHQNHPSQGTAQLNSYSLRWGEIYLD